MSRPPLRDLLLLAVALGVGSGAVEVALRASPRLGMGLGEVLTWTALSAALAALYLLAAALVAWAVGRRAFGLLLAALVVVHAALFYRFELVLNEFLYDPRVWGGLLAVALGSLALGLALDPLVRRRQRGVRRLALVLGGLSLAAAAARSAPPSGQARGDRPNVLLITLDTTRPDQLAPYGSTNGTPAFARLAAEGALFEQALATAPLTEPSHLAILTGIPPYLSGLVSNGTDLGDRPAFLQRALQASGYTTAGFVSGFPLHGKYGWTQGFDVYDDDFGRLRGLHRLSLVKAWDQVALPAHTLRERRGDLAVDRALAWLEDSQGSAFFLWVHLFDPHGPYEAPDHPFDPPTSGAALPLPPYWPPPHRAITSAEWLTEAYRAEIRYTDALVGRLIAALEAQGVLDDTIVALTADHGESLTEHGYYFDHGDFLYDPELKVPFIVRYPPAVRAGTRIPCQVSNLDTTPTILALLGIDDGQARQGLDRRRELAGGDCSEAPVLATTVGGRFVESPPIDHALRARGHKLIRKGQGGEECYNLLSDPGELSRLGAGCLPGLAESLSQAIEGGAPVASPEMDAQTREALEALGYVE